MSATSPSLLARVVRNLRPPTTGSMPPSSGSSMIAAAAGAYVAGARLTTGADTVPTGFDPQAAALFEALVEAAFLVATADGDFDDAERVAFEQVVVEACGGVIADDQLHGLVSDLHDQLTEDGLDVRVERVGGCVPRPSNRREVLRIAALLAHASEGVSEVERAVLERLAKVFAVEPTELEAILAEVEASLAAAAAS